MTSFDRLTKLAEDFYRQARATSDAMKQRSLMQRGDRFFKKAQELQREQVATQAIYPKPDPKIRQD
jgi:DNA replication initiation complex subunit (GINS family)